MRPDNPPLSPCKDDDNAICCRALKCYICLIMYVWTYLITKLSPLIRYCYIRAPMTKNEVIKKLSNINGFFCWRCTCFWLLRKIICHNYNILVTICGCGQRPNEVYSYLLPATVGNWYRVQLFSWMIKLSFRLLALVYTKIIFKHEMLTVVEMTR